MDPFLLGRESKAEENCNRSRNGEERNHVFLPVLRLLGEGWSRKVDMYASERLKISGKWEMTFESCACCQEILHPRSEFRHNEWAKKFQKEA